LDRARRRAAAAGVAVLVDFVEADLTTWQGAGYDLVCSHYVHATRPLYGRLAQAVAPGGTLLLVAHQPGGDHPHGSEHTPQEIAEHLDPAAWKIERADTATRTAGAHHLSDTILQASRYNPQL
ncbi:MAG: SAM-dependent methyltransferase, partial [Nonomuraea sp.]|nr:SAM-dependent methyltransferase [Nonomuraea sp.]